jgi:hypothetical protein
MSFAGTSCSRSDLIIILMGADVSQVIAIPFNDQQIGQGFNFESRESVGTGLTVTSISEDPNADGQIVRTSFNSVSTQESLMESLGISVSADVRYGLFSGGAKFDFAQSHAVNSFSSFIAGRCEVHNATRNGRGFQLTPDAQALVNSENMKDFKTAFGDMFVRSLKTGGEFYVVAQITSVSEEHQSKMAASLHGEYNGLVAGGSFKASFDTAMKETSSRSQITVFMSQAGGIGAQTSFTGPDATKILERLSVFPQSVHEHPVGYEAVVATYDTIPILVAPPEEREDRNIVLADCLAQKSSLLKTLSDLDFLLGPDAGVFFENIPSQAELIKLQGEYRTTLNALMAHAIKVAGGRMEPPQLFVANPSPPPLSVKKRLVSNDDKVNFANTGAAIARSDALVSAFRDLQQDQGRQRGFDIGMGATEGNTLWGPVKQKLLDSLSFQEQIGFREASTFSLIRNNNSVIASKGADIAKIDPETETARKSRASGLFWLGFDIATGIFGDPAFGALGNTAMGPGSEKIRGSLDAVEHILLPSSEASTGFDASVGFNSGRRRNE